MADSRALVACLVIAATPCAHSRTEPPRSLTAVPRAGSVIITSARGDRVRLTAYPPGLLRVQTARGNEEFFPDERYDMIASLPAPESLFVRYDPEGITLSSGTGIVVRAGDDPLRLSFSLGPSAVPFLAGNVPSAWKGDTITAAFAYDPGEHFTGLGHGYYGRAESIDLRGSVISRNYGSEHSQQAPLIVPFYLSSKGYGLFLNSTFPNVFNFGHEGKYEVSITGPGRMDYFVIPGPAFSTILDRYTQLTGRPRLPPRAAFGLGLSDKGNDENSSDPSDEAWWKKKVAAHRSAGYPIDHIINDNRWRAGGGKRCESYFAWDTTRFPAPPEYQRWIRTHGLFVTLDFNRCIAQRSDGWNPSFNIPHPNGIEFGASAPDFTNPAARTWFWDLFRRKSLDPSLGYPGDALWIDEFDEMGKAPDSTILANGRSWSEMRNEWFLLIGETLVRDGWDRLFRSTRRPFVWVRGMTAGGQRYATLWSGDIKPGYDEMKRQIRGMQLAGLSGFPFWGHDAGGFNDWTRGDGPDEAMYRQWSMAMGSFSPFWKPHGMGKSRWPLDRSAEAQRDAHTYTRLRYELMPYLYTYAHRASATGIPVAKAMILDHQQDSSAWRSDLQYMWGDELLVAPVCSDSGDVEVWLPRGSWFSFWTDSVIEGGRTITVHSREGVLPLFVKAGSVIPAAPFALGTAFIAPDSLTIHVYAGANGSFNLYEDDGASEDYRTAGAYRITPFTFDNDVPRLSIGPPKGQFRGASPQRAYRVIFHGFSRPEGMLVNGRAVTPSGYRWDAQQHRVTVERAMTPVSQTLTIELRFSAH